LIYFFKKFSEAPLGELLLENIKLAGYKNPAPIQKYGIPIALMGRDLMGCAQTGLLRDSKTNNN